MLTLDKDNRQSSFKLNRDDVQTCMDGNLCSLITMELARFIRHSSMKLRGAEAG